ncbi:DUF2460 domain containing protein [Lysobacter dokdonensis DS-58]|uniref:DUF2460 domain containing protein n=1 Tax=Lysobacter dokdonensis DS-58 TaxID=1300345 RepID=A0A0A2WMH4_9GAMM|nr:DUF2460 domain-containing protein [Lysobacter dokdonensis]KGQ19937.1 DUF2460 domain containing protein [Lysobacter dokdonensis DS-58]
MAYLTTRMPERIAAGFVIGPRWQTLVVPLDNGREQRNAQWLFPKYEARANIGMFNAADRQAIRNLFMACRGRANPFRVRDPLDYTATAQPLYTVGGVTYLARSYAYGGETAYRLIQAPVTATLSGAGSVDLTTGIVTGANPVADTWTGTFDIWMRFESDFGAITATTTNVQTADIELVEVRR